MNMTQKEYEKNSKLKREDVKMLQEWCVSQPHLPQMTEQEVIWFLQSCYFSNEGAKIAIDNYFTMKTMSPELFKKRDFKSEVFQANLKLGCFTILPKKTHQGDTVCFFKFLDPNPENFSLNEFIKIFDMVVMLDLYLNGTQEGLRYCFDVKDISFGHVAKLSLVSLKKFLLYLQEGMPVRLRGLHYFNATPVLDKALTLIKPFLKKEVLEMLTIHQSLKTMEQYIPLDCLPIDYGGKCDSVTSIYEKTKKEFIENEGFFEHQDEQLVDESKRPGKAKNVSDIFGVEGTFKKLDLF
ncbi:alpha-tocopherol transfer protein [Coccinella septempunctata]|uniref:alpha-tocopherol transfer protein n=1 Tax=Coccinella septempunctata TaxID=41139 RepID=UPI001D07E41D|nr:alpha-tocopherol transfer protein [Coccinella septempunctata]